ncbi:heparan-alpha-glucosaminide N-acetyltransferase domain-containing protein [Sinomicrobium sp. M5D2P17]
MQNNKRNRLLSIDAFRALIMLLMIFVNTLWTLKDIPGWIGHRAAEEDGLGLADTIFPAFLFIVGLSVPYAIQNRTKKGHTQAETGWHIIIRTLALVVMGLFLVNLEHYSATSLLPKGVWLFCITTGFFLVWLDYPREKKRWPSILKAAGIIILLLMAILYKGEDDSGNITGMQNYWWGILGKIGWSYFVVSIIFLFSKGRLWIQAITLAGLILFNIASHSGVLSPIDGIRPYLWFLGNGSSTALTACGVVVSLIYQRYRENNREFLWIISGMAIVFIALGLLARKEWIISKILATPSFVLVCSGISMAGYALMVWITDIKGWSGWYRWISPAGTSTLTCYLLPYLHNALLTLFFWQLPEILRTGMVGICKSLLYAFLIITITGLLEKKRIRLKI